MTDFFWGVDATTDRLVKIILTTDSNDPHTVENVGSFSQFVGPLTNPQGFGVVNGVGYVSALDNDGSLWELLDFKFTSEIADQSWTVGTAVSLSAPATEDGETPITYAISPTLPAGVTLDTSTGEISGTPTASADATDYTLTATDDNDIEATLTFSASVAMSSGTPSAPLNLTAAAQSNGTSVALDWDAPSDDGDTAITDYEYSSNDGSTFTAIGSTDTDYTVTGLDKNTEYDFQVRAVNSDGSGTATATVTTTTAITTSTAPQSLSVTVPVNGTSLAASWDAPSDDGGELTDYEYSTNDGSTWTSTGSTSTSYTITGLDKNTEYDVKVRAVNSAGNGTASSTVTKTTATTTPSAPQSLTFSTTQTTITAEWTAPTDNGGATISRYDVRIDGGSWIDAGLDLEHVFGSLDPNTEYDIDVAAVNSAGRGTQVSGSSTTDATTPNAPTGLSVTIGETTADLSWTAPSDNGGESITSYEVSSDDGGTWTDTGDTDLTYQFTGLTANTEYDFKVRAVNSEGSGTASSTVTATTNAAAAALGFGAGTIANQAWEVGTAVSVTLPEATGGQGTIAYSLAPATLPDGITFTAGTRVLAGTPTDRFTSTLFTYTATDANNATATLTFAISVIQAVSSAYPFFPDQPELTESVEVGEQVVGQSVYDTAGGNIRENNDFSPKRTISIQYRI